MRMYKVGDWKAGNNPSEALLEARGSFGFLELVN